MRALGAGLLVAVLLGLWCIPARADGLLLLEENPQTDYRPYGWLFLGLSLASLAVAANDYQETQYNLNQAKKSYNQYLTANTTQSATDLHNQTESSLSKARDYESTTNAALGLALIFAATAYASWAWHGTSNTPLLLSQNSVTWQVRF